MDVYDPNPGAYQSQAHRKTHSCCRNIYKQYYFDGEREELVEAQFIRPRNKWHPATQNGDWHFCGCPLEQEVFRDSIWDHCHISGKYRGIARNNCNLNYSRIDPDKVVIPVVLHNLKGYDAPHNTEDRRVWKKKSSASRRTWRSTYLFH